MSNASIGLNNKAIEHINAAYSLYDEGIEDIKIKDRNDNPDAKDIVQSIENAQAHLNTLKSRINGLNSKISMALEEKARREEARRKAEEEANARARERKAASKTKKTPTTNDSVSKKTPSILDKEEEQLM